MAYTPKPVQQQTYTEPAGGAAKDVASVTVMMEGLADGLSRVNFEGFHWSVKSANTRAIKRGAYSVKEQTWYAIGDGGLDFLEVSQDHGRTWVDKTGTIGLTASEQNHDIKINAAGDHVIIPNGSSRGVYSVLYSSFAYGTISYTHTVNALSHVCDGGMIEYDEVAALWIAVYRSGAVGMKANTSPDRTTYTNRSANLPAAWTAYVGTTQNPACTTNKLGRTLAVFFDDTAGTHKWRTATSINGGVNWTATTQGGGAFAPTTFDPETISKPAYDEILNAWYIVGAKTTGTDSTEVWESVDDGATWQSKVNDTTSDIALQDIVWSNGVLVGVNIDGRIYVSTNRGVTWKIATRNPITSAARPFIRVGNGQLMVWNSGDKTSIGGLRLGAVGG